jgi:DNA topoisomerase-3
MDVYICEKPSQGREVAKVLGVTKQCKGYMEGRGKIVTWCVGHLFEAYEPHEYDPKYKKWVAQDLPILPPEIRYKVKKNTSSQFRIIKGLLKKATNAIIATDGDAEGEAIGRDVLLYANYKGPIQRVWLTSTDEATIRDALKKIRPASETDGYYLAAKSRAALDWLIGMNFSRALAIKNANDKSFKISYGRVQSAAWAMCCKREREILDFKPTEHFGVTAIMSALGENFETHWVVPDTVKNEDGLVLDIGVAEYALKHVMTSQAVVKAVDYEPKQKSAPLPYNLTALIKDTARFGLSPDDTKKGMQALYDPPLSAVTYPRTDSQYLPESMLDWVEPILENAKSIGFECEVSTLKRDKVSRCWNIKKVSAHHAIIPTRKKVDPNTLTPHCRIIYELVMRRFLMQFAENRVLNSSLIVLDVAGLTFKATGSSEAFSGWKSLELEGGNKDKADAENSTLLPVLTTGQTLICQRGGVVSKKTKAPQRYTLSSLIVEMGNAAKFCDDKNLSKVLKEGDGIGTEATRPDIVTEILKKKQITVNKKNQITVPPLALRFVETKIPHELKTVDMTATLDLALRSVQDGKLSHLSFVAAQKEYVSNMVAKLLNGY